jgi:hypothetical protein
MVKLKGTFVLALLITAISFAQNGINYKAVIQDGSGAIIANDLIQVQFIILDGAVNVYEETHTPNTDSNGMVILNIGEGTPISGTFPAIDWSSNNHFLNVQINTGGGFQDMGTTSFKTVPYALMAKDVENKTWTTNGTKIYYDVGYVGIGITNPNSPLSILQPTGSSNTVRIESQDHSSGKDLLELQVPSGTAGTSQFIEMQNGAAIVAVINSDGSARFKSVQFEDFSTQTTAAIGPIAFGSIGGSGTIYSGSGNYTVVWNAVNLNYEITISGENYNFSLYTTMITPTTMSIKAFRTSSSISKLLVILYNSAGAQVQGNFSFLTFK